MEVKEFLKRHNPIYIFLFHSSFEVILFEELSAMGTVGLSLGLTPHLSSAGKCIIILSMLVGRIGPLTFLLALGRRAIGNKYSYPEEDVVLG